MINQDDRRQLLSGTRLFAQATLDILQRAASTLQTVSLRAGDNLFKKGDKGDALYIIASGSVKIHDDDLILNTLHTGEAFGELSALDEETRSASITAETDTVLLKLEMALLYSLIDSESAVAKSLIVALCKIIRDRIHDLTAESLQVRAFELELEIGQKIQIGFLPEKLPKIPGWEIDTYFQAAREVAGDFYDVFDLPGHQKIALIVGDVCDKGVGAALFMALFRSLLRASARSEAFTGLPVGDPSRQHPPTSHILLNSVTLTNNYVAHTHGASHMFTTLFFGILDPATGVLEYINAGHEAPVIIGDNAIKDRLEPSGPVIGLFPDAQYSVKEKQLHSGDTLFAYTDGVTDVRNESGTTYTEEDILALVAQESSSACQLLGLVRERIENFMGEARQFDDITMLAVTRNG